MRLRAVHLCGTIALTTLFSIVLAKKSKIPLIADSDPRQSEGIPGCTFDGEFYELEEEWKPEMEPFGLMICVLCKCTTTLRKGKIVGTSSCRNFKHECPDVECENPVLQPGDCCKRCPGQEVSEIAGDSESREFDLVDEDEDSLGDENSRNSGISGTVLVSLLTGANAYPRSRTSGAARGYFTIHDNSLSFTISFSGLTGHPEKLIFSDALNTTLFEFEVESWNWKEKSVICGVWPNIPSIHRSHLVEKMISVTLVTRNHPRGEVRGWIESPPTAEEETFSAVLIPDIKESRLNRDIMGSGGIVMLTLKNKGKSIHFSSFLGGIFAHFSTEVPDEIQATYKLVKRNKVLREMSTTLSSDRMVFAGVWNAIKKSEQKAMGRGQLHFVVEVKLSQLNKVYQLMGLLLPKKSCNTMQAVLSGSDALEHLSPTTTTGASGSAVFKINENGAIDYKVRIVGLHSPVIGLTVEDVFSRKNARKVIFDMMSSYDDGWAIGTLRKFKAYDIQMLLHNRLYINIATEAYEESHLRGRITSLPYDPVLDLENAMPISLSGQGVTPPLETSSAGHAWIAVDINCNLHYEIVLAGINTNSDKSVSAHLHGYTILDEGPLKEKKAFNAFNGNGQVKGVVKNLKPDLFRYLDKGHAYIQVSTKAHPRGEISGQVTLHNQCADRDSPSFDQSSPQNGVGIKEDPWSCTFESSYYLDGSEWIRRSDSCQRCICKKKYVICEELYCPEVKCINPVYTEGQCCPICLKEEVPERTINRVESDREGCILDHTLHPVGTSWNPIVPPFGVMKCALCYCMPGNVVNCTKITCPKLDCLHPIRLDPGDCCKVCPAPSTEERPSLVDHDLMQADIKGACVFGDEYYRDGEEWSPNVLPAGKTIDCITCRCKNGKTKCKRKKCPNLGSCERKLKLEGQCCEICADDLAGEASTSRNL